MRAYSGTTSNCWVVISQRISVRSCWRLRERVRCGARYQNQSALNLPPTGQRPAPARVPRRRGRKAAEMPAAAEKLTYAEFQLKYGHSERPYEYWHGEARPKAMPTWIHGLIQAIISEFLTRAGFVAGSEVELRIVPDAFPRPDIIATAGEVEDPYPTRALDIVVEILSADD